MTKTNISVSPEVKATVPGVLIEWICGVAVSDECRQTPVQTFTLMPDELGGRSIQNIRHADKLQRVFGFQPVRCRLQVLGHDNQYRMVMAN